MRTLHGICTLGELSTALELLLLLQGFTGKFDHTETQHVGLPTKVSMDIDRVQCDGLLWVLFRRLVEKATM